MGNCISLVDLRETAQSEAAKLNEFRQGMKRKNDDRSCMVYSKRKLIISNQPNSTVITEQLTNEWKTKREILERRERRLERKRNIR
ncbi:hypothetical protein Trydic_g10234 [Trypoxylus dichotomus]